MASRTLRRLLALAGAPLIWFAHFLVCYVIVSLTCAAQLTQERLFGLNAAELGVAAATLVAGALIVGLAIASWRRWRNPAQSDPDMDRFLALSTMMLCAISLLSMLWVAFPTSILPTCAA